MCLDSHGVMAGVQDIIRGAFMIIKICDSEGKARLMVRSIMDAKLSPGEGRKEALAVIYKKGTTLERVSRGR